MNELWPRGLDIQRARLLLKAVPRLSWHQGGTSAVLWASLVTVSRSFVETLRVPSLFSGRLSGALEDLAIREGIQEWRPAVNQPLCLSVQFTAHLLCASTVKHSEVKGLVGTGLGRH